MPHDGQDMTETASVLLPDLLGLTGESVAAVEGLLERCTAVVRQTVTVDGKVSGAALEANQTAAHGLAWIATYAEAQKRENYMKSGAGREWLKRRLPTRD